MLNLLTWDSNAAIVPIVYFFYPETAYRSLEEMDAIFLESKSIWDTVKIAHDLPRRYGKKGELLINYEDTDTHRRRSSVAHGTLPKPTAETYENGTDVEKTS